MLYSEMAGTFHRRGSMGQMTPRACPILRLRVGDVYTRNLHGDAAQYRIVIEAPEYRHEAFGSAAISNIWLRSVNVERDGRVLAQTIQTHDESVWLVGRVEPEQDGT